MNCIYRSIWNDSTGTFVAVPENAKSAGKKTSSCTSAKGANAVFALKALAISVLISLGANVYALPVDGVVSAGNASISSGAGSTTITQSSQNVAINWQSFSIAPGEAVRFIQPNSSSVALNRVWGSDPSSILGSLTANGKVFLINPNGILFGQGAQVNVSGLVASTLNITDSDFMAGTYKFTGTGGTILNRGSINADGGYVALLGANVSNDGIITARLGTVALAAGTAITLDVAGDGLLNVTVNQGAVNALIQNGGLIQADGGQVLLTAQAAGNLLQSAVNNTGVIQAQTIENHNGTIKLLGDMQSGTVNVGGTLDASAPNGGNGGFIETSAAHVNIANDAKITTAAPTGQTGTWLIDPADFTIGVDITGLALTNLLVNNNVTISTVVTGINTATTFFATPGQGNINVNEIIGTGSGNDWTAAGTPTTLTLNAANDVNINAAITATKGNLVVCCGHDVNVNAAITTTNGSVLLNAGHDINVVRSGANTSTAITTTDGNIELCAGHDVILNNTFNAAALMTLTGGSTALGESLANLGVPLGLTLRAGNAATGPGVAGGTVTFVNGGQAPAGTYITVTTGGPGTPTNIFYNPINYSTPTPYSLSFTGTAKAAVTSFMLVYPDGADRAYNGTKTATFTGLKGTPVGVTLNPGGTANFDTANAGINKTVTFSNFTLAQVAAIVPGDAAINFALPADCCGPAAGSGRTSAAITPAHLTVIADDKTRLYGAANPTFTDTITGFVNGETLATSGVAGVAALSTAAIPTTPVGTAPIIAGVGSLTATNYDFTPVNGTLTITPIISVPSGGVLPGGGVVLPGGGVVLPGGIVLPVETTPGTTGPIAEEMMGGEAVVGGVPRLGVVPARLTSVVLADTPAQLLTVASPIAPPVIVPETVVAPVETKPQLYVAPHHPRKQDRN